MTEERRDISARLENWARLHRQDNTPIMEKGERRAFDLADAQLLDALMPQLVTQARVLLWWCYVKQDTAEQVCRKIGIYHRPATCFVDAFRIAQQAIEALVVHANSSAGTLTDGIMSISDSAATP
ncbi:hypothetical protein [Massilia varians]|uniref:hypothetical protein n=1 Tax=Massilia varians TaxID=457921 RepID=UPI002557586D|nr:hypothetical protein [Massilia varians]MDK6077926.1 hypothetical protein [Massilia varians]